MFTGIVETTGTVQKITPDQDNLHFEIASPLSAELKIDQSISHNGVCLTVVKTKNGVHTVTAIRETLDKSNLGKLQTGDLVNLERCIVMNGRLDGHIVQGHVDQTAICTAVADQGGSWLFTFSYATGENLTVEKGSICVNGVSLTVVNSKPGEFSVAIIPYTYEHTSFARLKAGDTVNLEFDIIGKYIAAYLKQQGRI